MEKVDEMLPRVFRIDFPEGALQRLLGRFTDRLTTLLNTCRHLSSETRADNCLVVLGHVLTPVAFTSNTTVFNTVQLALEHVQTLFS